MILGSVLLGCAIFGVAFALGFIAGHASQQRRYMPPKKKASTE